MSHFTRLKTQINDREMLLKALSELKYEVLENSTVRGYQGNSLKAAVVARPQGQYDIGFERQGDGSYVLVADWWGVQKDANLTQEKFLAGVTQRYAYNKVLLEATRQGFQLVEESTTADKTLKLTVRRWQ